MRALAFSGRGRRTRLESFLRRGQISMPSSEMAGLPNQRIRESASSQESATLLRCWRMSHKFATAAQAMPSSAKITAALVRSIGSCLFAPAAVQQKFYQLAVSKAHGKTATATGVCDRARSARGARRGRGGWCGWRGQRWRKQVPLGAL